MDPNAEEATKAQLVQDEARYAAAVVSGRKAKKGKKGKPTRMNAANTVARIRYDAASPEVKAEIKRQIDEYVEERKLAQKKKIEEMEKPDLVMK